MRRTAPIWGTLLLLSLVACGGNPEPKVVSPPLLSKVRQWQAQGQRLLGQGEWELAKSAFEDARQLAESLDDLPGAVEALNSLGAIAVQERRAEEGVLLHRRALAFAEETRQPSFLLQSLTRLAAALHVLGQTAEAQERYQRALQLAQDSLNRKQEAIVLNNLGLLDLKAGAFDAAKAKFESASKINQSLNERREWSANVLNLGLAAEAQGQLDEAQRQFESALEMDKANEQQLAIAGDLAALARILEKRGNKPTALSYYQRAYWSFQAIEDKLRAAEVLTHAVRLARELNRSELVKDLERERATSTKGDRKP